MKSKAPGDVLLTEHPFVHVIANKQRGKRCDECLKDVKSGEMKRCSACHTARYCSAECQKAAWYFHKPECECIKRAGPKLPDDSVLLFYRLLLRYKYGDTKCAKEYLGKNRCFDDLMDHMDDIKEDGRRKEDFTEICCQLRLFVGEDYDLPDKNVLMKIFGRMVINTFSICDGEMQAIGSALYLGASVLDHSCKPNAVATFRGTELQIRATEPIVNIDVEDIFISYTELLSSTQDRQTELEQQYYFTCQCGICMDEERELSLTAAKCPTAGCNARIHPDNTDEKYLPCQACNKSHFPKDYHEQKDTVTMEAKFLLTKCKKWKAESDPASIYNHCKQFLCAGGSILHAHNVYIMQVLDYLMDACIDTQRWDEACSYAATNVLPYSEIYPEYHPMVGIHLMKYAKILQYLGKLKDALTRLQQAEVILVITHGEDHPLVVQLRELLDQCQEEMRSRRIEDIQQEENEEDD